RAHGTRVVVVPAPRQADHRRLPGPAALVLGDHALRLAVGAARRDVRLVAGRVRAGPGRVGVLAEVGVPTGAPGAGRRIAGAVVGGELRPTGGAGDAHVCGPATPVPPTLVAVLPGVRVPARCALVHL